ncbi:4a-hydroxytetrahydrobiopterin dehydratase [Kocuria palustris]|uniref:4a-hydroxytetrahydrobiopterin dehydratase n=1 Tax=Kocuria palustris TaxID=71999 RepID=UPI00119E7C0C|nr:4a-hydroxytetrahydrobiopterin dehydratase [Kocuria palustris]
MDHSTGQLTDQEIAEAQLEGWTVEDGVLRATFGTGDFTSGLKFVSTLAEIAEEVGHHPDVLLTYPSVQLSLISHDVEAITQKDVNMARRLSELAGQLGISSS